MPRELPIAARQPVESWALVRPLDEVAIELTLHCNLSCAMCSVWEGKRHGIELELARRTLDEARALGARTFTPCGAESFMRRDALDLFEHADAIGFEAINVVTNGVPLTRAKLDRLERLSSIHLNLSIDGPEPVHDALRGRGTFGRVERVLEELASRRIAFAISTVVMRQTIDTIEDVLDLASRYGVNEVSLQPYQPEIGGPRADHDTFRFHPADEEMLRERLAAIGDYAASSGIEVYTHQLLEHVPAYLARGLRPIPPGGCFLPSRFLLIDADGDAYPCFFMRDRRIGNVNEAGLAELWHNEVQQELNLMALNENCPGCLAACSDVDTYNELAAAART